MNKYDEIINMPHHVSKTRPRMSLEQRSSQFAPFQALTGYDDKIKENERITSDYIILSEEKKEEINKKLELLKINPGLKVNILYFEKDKYKSGGSIKRINSYIKKIDEIYKQIILVDKSKVSINSIIDINLCYNENGERYE